MNDNLNKETDVVRNGEKHTPYFDMINENNETENYEMVNHPEHYNQYSVEVIDMMLRIWGPEATIQWCEMTAFKYRMRMGTKPENRIEQDINKEKWYLDKACALKQQFKFY